MQQFETRKAAGEEPGQLAFAAELDNADGKRSRFMKAIPTRQICLSCHGGDSVPPPARPNCSSTTRTTWHADSLSAICAARSR